MRQNERHPLFCYQIGNQGEGGAFKPFECIGTALLNSINNTSRIYLHIVRGCVITLYVELIMAIQVNCIVEVSGPTKVLKCSQEVLYRILHTLRRDLRVCVNPVKESSSFTSLISQLVCEFNSSLSRGQQFSQCLFVEKLNHLQPLLYGVVDFCTSDHW